MIYDYNPHVGTYKLIASIRSKEFPTYIIAATPAAQVYPLPVHVSIAVLIHLYEHVTMTNQQFQFP